jgi:hypothetical protein
MDQVDPYPILSRDGSNIHTQYIYSRIISKQIGSNLSIKLGQVLSHHPRFADLRVIIMENFLDPIILSGTGEGPMPMEPNSVP